MFGSVFSTVHTTATTAIPINAMPVKQFSPKPSNMSQSSIGATTSCSNCGITTRSQGDGLSCKRPLCTSCASYHEKHGHHRPIYNQYRPRLGPSPSKLSNTGQSNIRATTSRCSCGRVTKRTEREDRHSNYLQIHYQYLPKVPKVINLDGNGDVKQSRTKHNERMMEGRKSTDSETELEIETNERDRDDRDYGESESLQEPLHFAYGIMTPTLTHSSYSDDQEQTRDSMQKMPEEHAPCDDELGKLPSERDRIRDFLIEQSREAMDQARSKDTMSRPSTQLAPGETDTLSKEIFEETQYHEAQENLTNLPAILDRDGQEIRNESDMHHGKEQDTPLSPPLPQYSPETFKMIENGSDFSLGVGSIFDFDLGELQMGDNHGQHHSEETQSHSAITPCLVTAVTAVDYHSRSEPKKSQSPTLMNSEGADDEKIASEEAENCSWSSNVEDTKDTRTLSAIPNTDACVKESSTKKEVVGDLEVEEEICGLHSVDRKVIQEMNVQSIISGLINRVTRPYNAQSNGISGSCKREFDKMVVLSDVFEAVESIMGLFTNSEPPLERNNTDDATTGEEQVEVEKNQNDSPHSGMAHIANLEEIHSTFSSADFQQNETEREEIEVTNTENAEDGESPSPRNPPQFTQGPAAMTSFAQTKSITPFTESRYSNSRNEDFLEILGPEQLQYASNAEKDGTQAIQCSRRFDCHVNTTGITPESAVRPCEASDCIYTTCFFYPRVMITKNELDNLKVARCNNCQSLEFFMWFREQANDGSIICSGCSIIQPCGPDTCHWKSDFLHPMVNISNDKAKCCQNCKTLTSAFWFQDGSNDGFILCGRCGPYKRFRGEHRPIPSTTESQNNQESVQRCCNCHAEKSLHWVVNTPGILCEYCSLYLRRHEHFLLIQPKNTVSDVHVPSKVSQLSMISESVSSPREDCHSTSTCHSMSPPTKQAAAHKDSPEAIIFGKPAFGNGPSPRAPKPSPNKGYNIPKNQGFAAYAHENSLAVSGLLLAKPTITPSTNPNVVPCSIRSESEWNNSTMVEQGSVSDSMLGGNEDCG